ncbi:MAG TPA: acyltransferase family protein, partial [Bryobacteraceae bacterium]|nr:acyltransferase family protein [Bryobacteraceae bacterium]
MFGTKRAELCAGGGSRRPYRPDIQGLRAIAVLMVVAFHCGLPGFPGGFAGVDVFFVLSGYLITGLLVAEIRETGELALLQFYARRVRRLLPAAALTLATTLLIGAAILAPQEVIFAGRAGRAAAVYLSNVFFAINAADYFAPNVKTNPLLHTWSLAVEEQFYLFWPLLILLGLRVFRSVRALALAEGAVALFSLAASLGWSTRGGTFAFYQLPARAWEFGIGGLAVLLSGLPTAWRAGLGWVGLLVVVSSAKIVVERDFPGWMALIPVMGTAAVLVAWPSPGVSALLSLRPLQAIGNLSYSWYLWHWPLLVLARALWPGLGVAGAIAVAIASLALAAGTHYLVENPIRFHPRLVVRPRWCIGLAAGLAATSLAAASLTVRLGARLANAPEMRTITAAAGDIGSPPVEQCVSLGESAALRTCVFGDSSSAVHIVLFGDSHAIQWFNPLRRMAEQRGWKLTTVVKSGCPAAEVSPSGFRPGFAAGCAGWRQNALRWIRAQRPAVVFVASAAVYHVSPEPWRSGTRSTLTALAAASSEVAAMRDTPIAGFDIPTCLAHSRRLYRAGHACDIERTRALDPAIFAAEKAAARGLANVHFLDLTG